MLCRLITNSFKLSLFSVATFTVAIGKRRVKKKVAITDTERDNLPCSFIHSVQIKSGEQGEKEEQEVKAIRIDHKPTQLINKVAIAFPLQ